MEIFFSILTTIYSLIDNSYLLSIHKKNSKKKNAPELPKKPSLSDDMLLEAACADSDDSGSF